MEKIPGSMKPFILLSGSGIVPLSSLPELKSAGWLSQRPVRGTGNWGFGLNLDDRVEMDPGCGEVAVSSRTPYEERYGSLWCYRLRARRVPRICQVVAIGEGGCRRSHRSPDTPRFGPKSPPGFRFPSVGSFYPSEPDTSVRFVDTSDPVQWSGETRRNGHGYLP